MTSDYLAQCVFGGFTHSLVRHQHFSILFCHLSRLCAFPLKAHKRLTWVTISWVVSFLTRCGFLLHKTCIYHIYHHFQTECPRWFTLTNFLIKNDQIKCLHQTSVISFLVQSLIWNQQILTALGHRLLLRVDKQVITVKPKCYEVSQLPVLAKKTEAAVKETSFPRAKAMLIGT